MFMRKFQGKKFQTFCGFIVTDSFTIWPFTFLVYSAKYNNVEGKACQVTNKLSGIKKADILDKIHKNN